MLKIATLILSDYLQPKFMIINKSLFFKSFLGTCLYTLFFIIVIYTNGFGIESLFLDRLYGILFLPFRDLWAIGFSGGINALVKGFFMAFLSTWLFFSLLIFLYHFLSGKVSF